MLYELFFNRTSWARERIWVKWKKWTTRTVNINQLFLSLISSTEIFNEPISTRTSPTTSQRYPKGKEKRETAIKRKSSVEMTITERHAGEVRIEFPWTWVVNGLYGVLWYLDIAHDISYIRGNIAPFIQRYEKPARGSAHSLSLPPFASSRPVSHAPKGEHGGRIVERRIPTARARARDIVNSLPLDRASSKGKTDRGYIRGMFQPPRSCFPEVKGKYLWRQPTSRFVEEVDTEAVRLIV